MIELTNKIKVTETPDFTKKVEYLCKKINNTEWCGILIWKASQYNINLINYEIELIDIYLRSIDDPSKTNYEGSIDHIIYCEEMGYDNVRFGSIHSHHTMRTFFSSTDTNDLKSHKELYTKDLYVSVIVNNAGERSGKAVQVGDCKQQVEFTTHEGKKNMTISNGITQVVCDLEWELPALNINETWLESVEQLIKEHKNSISKTSNIITTGQIGLFDSYKSSNGTIWNKPNLTSSLMTFEDFIVQHLTGQNDITLTQTIALLDETFFFDVEDFILEYDRYYGKTSSKEECEMLNKLKNVLTPFKSNNFVKEMLTEINKYLYAK